MVNIIRILGILVALIVLFVIILFIVNLNRAGDNEISIINYNCDGPVCKKIEKTFLLSIVGQDTGVTHVAFTIDVTSTGARTIQSYLLLDTTNNNPDSIGTKTSTLFYDIFKNKNPTPDLATTQTFTWDSRNTCRKDKHCDEGERCKKLSGVRLCLVPTSEFEVGSAQIFTFTANVEATFTTLQGTTATTTNQDILQLSFVPDSATPCENLVLDTGNGETDVDCGGSNCPSCAEGLQCLVPLDCQTGNCDNGICASIPQVCGDGIITTPEVCDTLGPALGGRICIDEGFSEGTLSCAVDCLSFDTSQCTLTGGLCIDTGNLHTCPSYSSKDPCKLSGCSWDKKKKICKGTHDACDIYTAQNVCEPHGCFWV